MTSYGGALLEYDENGNMTKGPDTSSDFTYIYDIENRLIRVKNASANIIAEYYYDPFGRRLWKDVAGTRTYFLYANEGLIGEYDATGAEIKTYGYKPGSLWTTDPVFMKIVTNVTEYFFYQNDHLGTPQILTDQSGAIVWSADYDSPGEASVSIAAVENNLRFPGQYYDEETGLHYNWHRYYGPEVGRYTTTDPIGFGGGDMNLFVYVTNNPVNFVDPWGLYGRNDCSYYEKRCKESGGKYYCETVQKFCDNEFSKPPDPDPTRDDDYEGWVRCTRQCLQDCDDSYRDDHNQCPRPDPDTDGFWDPQHLGCHTVCYTVCGLGVNPI